MRLLVILVFKTFYYLKLFPICDFFKESHRKFDEKKNGLEFINEPYLYLL